MIWQAYVTGGCALLVERQGSRVLRYVWASDAGHVRGSAEMYPHVPQVEPVEIDQATFAEAWAESV